MNSSKLLDCFSKKKIIPINLSYLYNFANSNPEFQINCSKFIKDELSTRLCHRIINFSKLPHSLDSSCEIQTINKLYTESFNKIQKIKFIDSQVEQKKFDSVLIEIKEKHNNLENYISQALTNINYKNNIDYTILNKKLDVFFNSRIGIRTLINQHNEVLNNKNTIVKKCIINNIIENCVEDIIEMTNQIHKNEPVFSIQIKKHGETNDAKGG